MKLIDLLVQELPKLGGWTCGDRLIAQDYDGQLAAYNRKDKSFICYEIPGDITLDTVCDKPRIKGGEAIDHAEFVSVEQYEAALAASKQVEWSGEGLPPVGCECELFDCENWNPVIIKFVGDKYVVTERTDLGYEVVYCVAGRPERFRPILTEAERKRDEAGLAIYHAINWNAEGELLSPHRMEDYKKAYDAIAAGKIPGIKLAD